MVEIGQIAIKICGRDGGKFAVVVDKIDEIYFLKDGNVRRKKCNLKHLEFLDKVVKIKKNASSDEVKKELEKIGINADKKSAKKDKKEKLMKKRKVKSPESPKKENKKKQEKK